MLLISGFIAICAMLLPGISGSFILLMLGMYSVFIEALSEWHIVRLVSFLVGCVLGLIIFSRLLSFLLSRYFSFIMALLTGILIGSLNILWPWKTVLETVVDRHGKTIPLIQENIAPWTFQSSVGEAYLPLALLFMTMGCLLVFLLDVGSRSKSLLAEE